MTSLSPYVSVNPASGETLATFALHTDAQVEQILTSAHAAFQGEWRAMGVAGRAEIVGTTARLMVERIEHLAQLATREMGKRLQESRDEVTISASILAYYAAHAEQFLAARPIASDRFDAHVEIAPLGVLLGIQPWNYPYYQLARFAAPNLVAGNTVLVKHAPGVPQCALAFADLFIAAGAPKGAYTNVFLTNDQAGAVIDDPRVQGVALTGSERAGMAIAARAGANLKKSTMELGGSDAFLVLEDADMDTTVQLAILGRIGNCGQTCIGAKRFIIVGEARAREFVEKLDAAMGQLVAGDPMDEKTNFGPLSSQAALDHILEQIDIAVRHGARVVRGGARIERPGAYLEPTILVDVARDNPAYREEFFGPAAIVLAAADEDEAIAIANDSPYGLGGSVYSADAAHAARVASRMETGMVFLNYPNISSPELPFGGIKRSGYGKELSSYGIEEFINRKLVCSVKGTPEAMVA